MPEKKSKSPRRKGRRYSVDEHEKRDEIIKKIVAMKRPYREIAEQYGVSISSISRYLQNVILEKAATVDEARRVRDSEALWDEVLYMMEKAKKMIESCDAYLQDPENPALYYVGPRAHEITVVYEEINTDDNGKIHVEKRKADLQELMDMVRSHDRELKLNRDYLSFRSRSTDPRTLMLNSISQLRGIIELLKRIQERIKDNAYTIVNHPVYIQFVQVVQDALKDYPDAREALARRINPPQ